MNCLNIFVSFCTVSVDIYLDKIDEMIINMYSFRTVTVDIYLKENCDSLRELI